VTKYIHFSSLVFFFKLKIYGAFICGTTERVNERTCSDLFLLLSKLFLTFCGHLGIAPYGLGGCLLGECRQQYRDEWQ
jgi:hypothetical protein